MVGAAHGDVNGPPEGLLEPRARLAGHDASVPRTWPRSSVTPSDQPELQRGSDAAGSSWVSAATAGVVAGGVLLEEGQQEGFELHQVEGQAVQPR